MKKIILLGVIVIASFVTFSIFSKTKENAYINSVTKTNSSKTLIVYFSRVGNTNLGNQVDSVASASIIVDKKDVIGNNELVSKMIQKRTGGDIFPIVGKNSYPLDYDKVVNQASEELDSEVFSPLKDKVKNINEYDTVFIVAPIWWGTFPRPVFSFLKENDLSNKQVILFITHKGSNFGRSFNDLKKLAPNSTVIKGLDIPAYSLDDLKDSEKDIEKWFKENEVI